MRTFTSESPHWETFYHTGVQPETPTFGVRGFDTYEILATKLVFTLLIFGLNNRWHFRHSIIDCQSALGLNNRWHFKDPAEVACIELEKMKTLLSDT